MARPENQARVRTALKLWVIHGLAARFAQLRRKVEISATSTSKRVHAQKKNVVKIVTCVKKRCINDAAGSKVIFVPPPCRHNAALWLIGHSRVEPSSR